MTETGDSVTRTSETGWIQMTSAAEAVLLRTRATHKNSAAPTQTPRPYFIQRVPRNIDRALPDTEYRQS
jgi:hypothetical protein